MKKFVVLGLTILFFIGLKNDISSIIEKHSHKEQDPQPQYHYYIPSDQYEYDYDYDFDDSYSERPCIFCDRNHNGNCSTCHGTGELRGLDGSILGSYCRTCDGTGLCQYCGGDGIAD